MYVGSGEGHVYVISTANNTVVDQVWLPHNDLSGICSLPSGSAVYVTSYKDNTVSVINTSDNSIKATINVGNNPFGICSLPSGEHLYVSNFSDNTVSVLN